MTASRLQRPGRWARRLTTTGAVCMDRYDGATKSTSTATGFDFATRTAVSPAAAGRARQTGNYRLVSIPPSAELQAGFSELQGTPRPTRVHLRIPRFGPHLGLTDDRCSSPTLASDIDLRPGGRSQSGLPTRLTGFADHYLRGHAPTTSASRGWHLTGRASDQLGGRCRCLTKPEARRLALRFFSTK